MKAWQWGLIVAGGVGVAMALGSKKKSASALAPPQIMDRIRRLCEAGDAAACENLIRILSRQNDEQSRAEIAAFMDAGYISAAQAIYRRHMADPDDLLRDEEFLRALIAINGPIEVRECDLADDYSVGFVSEDPESPYWERATISDKEKLFYLVDPILLAQGEVDVEEDDDGNPIKSPSGLYAHMSEIEGAIEADLVPTLHQMTLERTLHASPVHPDREYSAIIVSMPFQENAHQFINPIPQWEAVDIGDVEEDYGDFSTGVEDEVAGTHRRVSHYFRSRDLYSGELFAPYVYYWAPVPGPDEFLSDYDWVNVEELAETTGAEMQDIYDAMQSPDIEVREQVLYEIAMHQGWGVMDDYPSSMNRWELTVRLGDDIE